MKRRKRDRKYRRKMDESDVSEESEESIYQRTEVESEIEEELVLYDDKLKFIERVKQLSSSNLTKLVN